MLTDSINKLSKLVGGNGTKSKQTNKSPISFPDVPAPKLPSINTGNPTSSTSATNTFSQPDTKSNKVSGVTKIENGAKNLNVQLKQNKEGLLELEDNTNMMNASKKIKEAQKAYDKAMRKRSNMNSTSFKSNFMNYKTQ